MSLPVGQIVARRRTTASHTISVPLLSELLRFVHPQASCDEYAHAVVELNILGRSTHTGRVRVLRHLRELYGLDDGIAFRLLRVLHGVDPDALPLLAGILAVSQDEFLRASWPVVARAEVGQRVTPVALGDAIADEFGTQVARVTYAKAGRNVAASWAQTGHLVGVRAKTRTKAAASPAAVALAVTFGYLEGGRGAGLLETLWFELLDLAPDERRDALAAAHRTGLVDVHEAGSVLEVDPSALLARADERSGRVTSTDADA